MVRIILKKTHYFIGIIFDMKNEMKKNEIFKKNLNDICWKEQNGREKKIIENK